MRVIEEITYHKQHLICSIAIFFPLGKLEKGELNPSRGGNADWKGSRQTKGFDFPHLGNTEPSLITVRVASISLKQYDHGLPFSAENTDCSCTNSIQCQLCFTGFGNDVTSILGNG